MFGRDDSEKKADGANGTYGANGLASGTNGPADRLGTNGPDNGANEANRATGVATGRPLLEPKPFLPKKGNYRGLLVYTVTIYKIKA